jgi:hypothetical protein
VSVLAARRQLRSTQSDSADNIAYCCFSYLSTLFVLLSCT